MLVDGLAVRLAAARRDRAQRRRWRCTSASSRTRTSSSASAASTRASSRPPIVPAVLESLRRDARRGRRSADGVSAAITAYFAVTSNSVQFGGGFELEASAEFLASPTWRAGWFEFDVLLQFNPFLLIADVSAGVGVYAGDKELMGVELFAHLEGPEPWFATASGRFRFFVVNVRFEVTVGGHAAPELIPAGRRPRPHGATSSPTRRRGRRGTRAAMPAGLVLRPEASTTRDPARRQHRRRADRGAARRDPGPLRRADPAPGRGRRRRHRRGRRRYREALSGVEVEDVLGWFAPAQFQVMRDEARLAAPSYEQHRAGVAFGAGGVAVPGDEADGRPRGIRDRGLAARHRGGSRPRGPGDRSPPRRPPRHVGDRAGRDDVEGRAGRRRAGGGRADELRPGGRRDRAARPWRCRRHPVVPSHAAAAVP